MIFEAKRKYRGRRLVDRNWTRHRNFTSSFFAHKIRHVSESNRFKKKTNNCHRRIVLEKSSRTLVLRSIFLLTEKTYSKAPKRHTNTPRIRQFRTWRSTVVVTVVVFGVILNSNGESSKLVRGFGKRLTFQDFGLLRTVSTRYDPNSSLSLRWTGITNEWKIVRDKVRPSRRTHTTRFGSFRPAVIFIFIH